MLAIFTTASQLSSKFQLLSLKRKILQLSRIKLKKYYFSRTTLLIYWICIYSFAKWYFVVIVSFWAFLSSYENLELRVVQSPKEVWRLGPIMLDPNMMPFIRWYKEAVGANGTNGPTTKKKKKENQILTLSQN